MRRLLGLVMGLAALAAPCADSAAAQERFSDDGGEVRFRADVLEREVLTDVSLIRHEGRYVVVHLAENRVFVFDGERAVWSAPAGTGTGFRLATGEHRWKFSTPKGMFRVKRMEKDPLWEAPDWHFVEKGQPVPDPTSPARVMRGIMGSTAIYLGDGIAIHGTNQPQLILNPDPELRRVSHGCIRLTNEAARTLMYMVDVGTPVLIF